MTAARGTQELVAEEYVTYQSTLQTDREDLGSGEQWISFVRGSDICDAASETSGGAVDTPEEPVDEVWFYAALDKQYHRLAVFLADDNGQILYKTDQLEANYCYLGKCGSP